MLSNDWDETTSCRCPRAHWMMSVDEVVDLTGIPAHRLLMMVRRAEFPAPADGPKGSLLVWSRAGVEAWAADEIERELASV